MRRLVAVVAVLVTSPLAVAAPAQADPGAGPLAVTVAVDGQPMGQQAVPIDPDQPVSLQITAANNSDTVRQVRTVRFAGGVLGLRFFAYDTVVPFDVPPHAAVSRTLVLDLGDLHGQAIGLVPASVELLDAGEATLGDVDTVTDVRGSILSLYGALGIVLLVFAVAAWVSAVRALGTRRRGDSRGGRVARFLPAGVGTGLLAVVWLSVLRVVTPQPAAALGTVAVGVLAAVAVGMIATRPEHDLEPLTTIIDPTVGVKAGVLEADDVDSLTETRTLKPAEAEKASADTGTDKDPRHTGDLDHFGDLGDLDLELDSADEDEDDKDHKEAADSGGGADDTETADSDEREKSTGRA